MRILVDYGFVCNVDNQDVTINAPDCLEVLHRLRDRGHTLTLVNFCGRVRMKQIQDYLKTIDNPFVEMYFVKHHKYKRHVAAYLGVDVVIDDRMDVLLSMKEYTTIHFPKYCGLKLQTTFKPTYTVDSWLEIEEVINNMRGLPNRYNWGIFVKQYCY